MDFSTGSEGKYEWFSVKLICVEHGCVYSVYYKRYSF